MKNLTRAEAGRFLLDHDNITILTHRRPDGDTSGSAAALCLGLRQLGKTAFVLENPEMTPRYGWLHQGLTKQALQPGDILVSVDVASPGMLFEAVQPLADQVQLRLDHHAASTSYAQRELVDGSSASCAEIVWDVLMEMGVQPDRPLAEAVYVGLSTDTGCFRFANTTAHTFQVAAACFQAGAQIFQLNQQLFETNSMEKLKMESWVVENVKLLQGGQLAVVAIPRQVEKETGVSSDDMDNISALPRTIAGVRMAATIRENDQGGCKLSLRAVPGLDAGQVAARFGGGGHKGAAGATLDMPLAQAAQAVEQAMVEAL